MKYHCKVIAIIELIFGIIGSFILANNIGAVPVAYGSRRSWGLSFFVFLLGILSSYVLFVILYSIYEILDNQEEIKRRLPPKENYGTYAGSGPKKPSGSNRSSSLFKKSSESLPEENSGWTCPKCGALNSNSSGTCRCGKRRY